MTDPAKPQINRRIVNKSPGFTRRSDFPPQNRYLIIVQLRLIKKMFKLVTLDPESPFHRAFLVFILEHAHIGPLTEDQPKGSENDRFAGPCFTGNNIETG
jgi:hypothetical protein